MKMEKADLAIAALHQRSWACVRQFIPEKDMKTEKRHDDIVPWSDKTGELK